MLNPKQRRKFLLYTMYIYHAVFFSILEGSFIHFKSVNCLSSPCQSLPCFLCPQGTFHGLPFTSSASPNFSLHPHLLNTHTNKIRHSKRSFLQNYSSDRKQRLKEFRVLKTNLICMFVHIYTEYNTHTKDF